MYCHGIPPIFFGGKYDLIQLHRRIIHQNDGISMRNWLKSSPPAYFYLKFKENNKNDMPFCYFSCLGWYCFQPMSMAALPAQAVADAPLTSLTDSIQFQDSSSGFSWWWDHDQLPCQAFNRVTFLGPFLAVLEYSRKLDKTIKDQWILFICQRFSL